jgi:hypothetical protein
MVGKGILRSIGVVLTLSVGTAFSAWGGADGVPRMTPDELKSRLGNPEVVILDVRFREGWLASERKIKGAMWEDPRAIDSWVDKYPKNLTFVLY